MLLVVRSLPVAGWRATAREIWGPWGWLQSSGTSRVPHWNPLWLLQVAHCRGWGVQSAGNPLFGGGFDGVVVAVESGDVVVVVAAGAAVVVVVDRLAA